MISRYTRPEMGDLWTLQARFSAMLKVEVAVAEVQSELGLIPAKAGAEICKKADFDIDRISELEKQTRHDVIAFVTNVAEAVGPYGRYVHFGLTSSDVLDSAMSLQIQQASDVLLASVDKLQVGLTQQIRTHSDALCAGRTHGIHAEPTTLGLKLAGHLMEFQRNRSRLERAFEQCSILKLSGAVGTYSFLPEKVEKRVAEKLGLRSEIIATQVIPRDRVAEVFNALALLGCAVERLAVELRHLQRTEVAEVQEGFSSGQKGSSAMPHKRNPISAENLTGTARLLRSYAQAAMENVALWHERDISHSSVERVILPDAFIIADYACDRLAHLVNGLEVDRGRMRSNMNLSQGQLFSSHVLLALIENGLSRERAYQIVQRLSHSLKPGESLKDCLGEDPETAAVLSEDVLEEIFSGRRHLLGIQNVLKRAEIN